MASPRRLNPTNGAMRREKLQRIVQMCLGELQTAEKLSEACDCSERSIYRYIASIRGKGTQIQGEPGYGYWISPRNEKAVMDDHEKDFGVALTNFIFERKPDILRADAKDVAVTMNALATAMAGILAGVEGHHGRQMMLKVMSYYETKIFNTVTDIVQKAKLELADKPAGAQGEN